MSTLITDYIDIVDNETHTLSKILAQSVQSGFIVGSHSASIYFESKMLLQEAIKDTKEDRLLLDNDLMLAAISRSQALLTEVISKMGISLFFSRYLLKKAYQNFDKLIGVVIRHNARVLDIPEHDKPIDEIMAELNNPGNKAMLEKSIAQLARGDTVSFTPLT